MRALNSNPNVDNSDLTNFPDGRLKNNDGSGNGTPINENVYGDLHQTIAKLMRLYGIIPNGLPDNETNGFQIVNALVALASKNDFILPLTVDTGIIQVPVKLNSMKDNESIVCKAGFNRSTETEIKGSDNVTFTATVSGNFQSGNYVRLVKTSTGVELIRLADNVSLDNMISLLLYLKKASQTQENAGLLDTVATTPLSNLTAFIRRVNGADSATYLATALRDGIYPKEHFAIVAGIGASPIKNKGWVSGLDAAGSGGVLPVFGDFTSASVVVTAGDSVVTVNMANNMSNTNYICKIYTQSEGSFAQDNDIGCVVFKPISTTQFQFSLRELAGGTQSLKFHIQVEQLS
jgi:hypothetical protein